MRRITILAALAAVVVAALITAGFATKAEGVALLPPVVKVVLKEGHGSGTHIGNGYIVTAAHVVDGATEVRLKTSDGRERPADVLWANKTYDVALVRTRKFDNLAASPLSCRVPEVGEKVRAEGNPLAIEFLKSWGAVATSRNKFGPWAEAIVVDLIVAPGMSGGPLFDEEGNLVGVLVGIPLMQLGFGNVSAVGFTYAVPASTVCGLMART